MKRVKLALAGMAAAAMFSPAVALAAGNSNSTHGQPSTQGSSHSQAGNHGQGQQNGQSGSGQSGSGQSGSKGQGSNHKPDVTALHTAIQKMQAAKRTEKTDHHDLVVAMQQYIAALQNAIAAGDTTDVQSATKQVQSLIDALHQAIKAQASAQQSQNSGQKAQQNGQLSNAIDAINTAAARFTTEGQLMKRVAYDLGTITNKLNAANPQVAPNANNNQSSGDVNNVGQNDTPDVNNTGNGTGTNTVNNNN